jgi:hypothetical protein
MSRVVIGIHGLGNKPPFDLLAKWWKSSICEGLRHISKPHKFFKFHIVGWSDLLHDQPEDLTLTDNENPLYISEPYLQAISWAIPKSDTRRKKIQKFIEEQLEKLFINEDGSVNFSSITDIIIQRYFRDLDVYYSEQLLANTNELIRNAIRERLYDVLVKYQNDKIMLIAHSMGSIIAYDVLKNNEDKINIDVLATIGSPLGLPIITGKIRKEHGTNAKVAVPNNIKKAWYNFSDLEDKVAINYDLADDYAPNKSGINIVDFEVYNNYEAHGKRNPHKAYGYLRTPQIAEKIDEFLMEDRNRMNTWFIRTFNKILSGK